MAAQLTTAALKRPRKLTGLAPWLRIVREAGPTPYTAEPAARTSVRGPREAYQLCADMATLEAESFVVLCLDAQHRLIARTEVSRGILNSTLVHPREIFRLAIALGAASVILVHNHPSGDPSPSADDRAITSQLVAAGRLLDLPVHDHIIIGGERFISFAEMGLL